MKCEIQRKEADVVFWLTSIVVGLLLVFTIGLVGFTLGEYDGLNQGKSYYAASYADGFRLQQSMASVSYYYLYVSPPAR